MAAALGLDQEHVGELGVRRADPRIRRQVSSLRGGDGGQARAMNRRDEETGAGGQAGQQRGASGSSRKASSNSRSVSSLSPISMTSAYGAAGTGLENVSGPPMTTSGSLPAGGGALVGERRDPGQIQAIDQARDLQLVGERKRDDREVAHRPRRFVGAQRLARRAGRAASSGRKARSALTSAFRSAVGRPSGSPSDDIPTVYGLG